MGRAAQAPKANNGPIKSLIREQKPPNEKILMMGFRYL